MQNITADQVENLKIDPDKCVEWVTQSFSLKNESQLPAKMSVDLQKDHHTGKGSGSNRKRY